MAEKTEISWCDATFNPWWGCVKVSPGCQHCYAETWANRYGHRVWGPAKTTERRTFGDKHWNEPLKWNKAAAAAGERRRVFCSSMADVFEDHPALDEQRYRLWELIEKTDNLDWLLLTKRPENVVNHSGGPMILNEWLYDGAFPDNVWIGTSVENQEQADKRIPELLKIPAKVRFLSCEPLLGPIDLRDYIGWHSSDIPDDSLIHWVIVGGESGGHARPMHPDWARSLRDQCQAAGVAYHFKQWGEYGPRIVNPPVMTGAGMVFPDKEILTRFGKRAAGRLLDGRTWDEFPTDKG